MDVIDLRRRILLSMASGKLPDFMNHLESGTFKLESGSDVNLYLTGFDDLPKGVMIYSDAFDIVNDKANKPMLGAFAALFIRGDQTLPFNETYNVYYINQYSTYAVNWGGSANSQYPSWRQSFSETRGFSYYRPSTHALNIRGFGTGDYDFKHNVDYHWLAWD